MIEQAKQTGSMTLTQVAELKERHTEINKTIRKLEKKYERLKKDYKQAL